MFKSYSEGVVSLLQGLTMKLNGLKITKYALLVLFGVVIFHLAEMGAERTTFLNVFLGWTTWFWIMTLMEAGDFIPQMTTVRSYLKGLSVSLLCGFVAGLVYLLFDKVL